MPKQLEAPTEIEEIDSGNLDLTDPGYASDKPLFLPVTSLWTLPILVHGFQPNSGNEQSKLSKITLYS